ncbi:Pentapeptide repeat-containing protein [Methanophagales archaeon]|nr:Pentapeptide repeat-containing protein [Methanophagales archaeon]
MESSKKKIEFGKSIFGSETDFESARIGSNAEFTGATFKQLASFSGAQINGAAEFNGATFKKQAIFSSAQIKGSAFLNTAYLFSWDSVPGDDDKKLKKFLRDDFDIGWAENSEILKSDDGKTISIFKDEYSAEIIIDEKKEKATLKITDGRIHELKVKKENGKLNIYNPATFGGDANFGSARIGSTAEFTEAVFKKEANFNGAQIEESAFFKSATFEGKADFISARIGGTADFTGAEFKQQAIFSRAQIEESAFFNPATFKGEANFGSARIGSNAEFTEAVFKKKASFNRAQIEESAFFNLATFEGNADFISARIGSTADFTGAEFMKQAIFNGAQIEESAFFNPATFEGDADFISARIGSTAEFTGATFKQQASFSSAQIEESAFFNPATFKGEANFGSARIGSNAVFTGAVFKGRASFNSVERLFKRFPLLFTRAKPKGRASFNGAQIEGDALFKSTIFDEVDFGSARIGSNAEFQGAEFKQQVYFNSAQIERESHFEGTIFDNDVSFQDSTLKTVFWGEPNVQFSKNIDLRGCIYDRFQPISFWKQLMEHLGPYDQQPFTQLEETFRRAGKVRLANDVYYMRKCREYTENIAIRMYLFSWDCVPGDDDEKLRKFLKDDLDIGWTENAEIRKSNDGKTLSISKDEKRSEIILDAIKKKATLKISDGRTFYLNVKKKQGKLNIYRTWGAWLHSALRKHGAWGAWLRSALRKHGAWLFDRFHWMLTGYGVRYYRLLFTIVPILIIGTIIFHLEGAVTLDIQPHSMMSSHAALPWSEAFWVSLNTFLPVVEIPSGADLEPSSLIIPVLGIKFTTFATLLVLAGWILVPVGVAGDVISGLLKRSK